MTSLSRPRPAVNPGPADFLDALYGDKPPGWLVIWTHPTQTSYWLAANDLAGVERVALERAGSEHVYYGVGLHARKLTSNKRGKAETVIAIPGLWLDVDCVGGKHSAQNLPTMDEARDFLGLFGLEPSIIVHTGGGLHVYWLFNRLWVFKDESARKQAADQVAQFQRGMIALAAARDWRLDNTSDLARVLRLPGTQNHKTDPPAPVTVGLWEPSRRYGYREVVAAIEALEGKAKSTQRPAGSGAQTDGGPLPRADLIARRCGWIGHCRADAANLLEPEWYGMVGVIALCHNGPALVHEWSRPYPGYFDQETDKKIDHALRDAGPITCDKVRADFGAWCADCTHKVKSPIVLGYEKKGKKERLPALVCLAEVESESVNWLWFPYIPKGKLTMLDGNPGEGKTFLMLALAAAISRGWPLPGEDGKPDEAVRTPSPVLYLTAEDGLGDTLRPRLDKAAADVRFIHALTGTYDEDGILQPVTLGETSILRQALEERKPALVVVDPIQAYLGAGVDMHRANEVRPILTGLAHLAEEFSCAVVTVRHLGKGQKDQAIYRGLGSIDFTSAARSVLIAGRDQKDKTRRAVVQIKNNLAPFGPAIGYAIEDGAFLWTGVSDLTAADLLAPEPVAREKGAKDEAADFLQEFLQYGPRKQDDVKAEADSRGISSITLYRAKKSLEVKSLKQGQKGPWYWKLSEDDQGPKNDDYPIRAENDNLPTSNGSPTAARDSSPHPKMINDNLPKHPLSPTATRPLEDDHSTSLMGKPEKIPVITFQSGNGESQNRGQVEAENSQEKAWTYNPDTKLWEGPDDELPF
ncbi:MAG: AAA family ATPase [Peptococcaceae bacterium]|nr:AAA family ATPase [Peptococcaceae bacterium]